MVSRVLMSMRSYILDISDNDGCIEAWLTLRKFSVILERSNCNKLMYLLYFILVQINSTRLMVSQDLPRSTVTNQITFDQPDQHSTSEFERVRGPSLPGAGFQIGNFIYHHCHLKICEVRRLRATITRDKLLP